MAVASVALPAVPRMTHAAKNDAGPCRKGQQNEAGRGDDAAGDHHAPRPKSDECPGEKRSAQTRGHIEDRVAGEYGRDVHIEVSGDLPAHDGQKADRAPSDDLPDRDDNKYADDFACRASTTVFFLRQPRSDPASDGSSWPR